MHVRTRMYQAFLVTTAIVMTAAGCGTIGTTPIVECTETVTVSVTGDTIPTFAWTPDCTIGRILVEEGEEERWGTETTGESLFQSPIVYGIDPPNAAEVSTPLPLFFGSTYRVSLWRFYSLETPTMPESLQLVGSAEFTPEDPADLPARRSTPSTQ